MNRILPIKMRNSIEKMLIPDLMKEHQSEQLKVMKSKKIPTTYDKLYDKRVTGAWINHNGPSKCQGKADLAHLPQILHISAGRTLSLTF